MIYDKNDLPTTIVIDHVHCFCVAAVLFYSNSMAMVTMSMVLSVLLHNLAKSTTPDHKVPKYITNLLNTRFGTVMRLTSLKVNWYAVSMFRMNSTRDLYFRG